MRQIPTLFDLTLHRQITLSNLVRRLACIIAAPATLHRLIRAYGNDQLVPAVHLSHLASTFFLHLILFRHDDIQKVKLRPLLHINSIIRIVARRAQHPADAPADVFQTRRGPLSKQLLRVLLIQVGPAQRLPRRDPPLLARIKRRLRIHLVQDIPEFLLLGLRGIRLALLHERVVRPDLVLELVSVSTGGGGYGF